MECCSSWKSKCNFTLDSQALYGNLNTEIHAHTHTFILLECWSRCCLSFHKTPYKFSRLAQVKVLKAKCLEYFELELVLKALNNNEVVVSLLANISRSSSPLVIYTLILIHYKDNDILYASTGGTFATSVCMFNMRLNVAYYNNKQRWMRFIRIHNLAVSSPFVCAIELWNCNRQTRASRIDSGEEEHTHTPVSINK